MAHDGFPAALSHYDVLGVLPTADPKAIKSA